MPDPCLLDLLPHNSSTKYHSQALIVGFVIWYCVHAYQYNNCVLTSVRTVAIVHVRVWVRVNLLEPPPAYGPGATYVSAFVSYNVSDATVLWCILYICPLWNSIPCGLVKALLTTTLKQFPVTPLFAGRAQKKLVWGQEPEHLILS